MKVFSIAFTAVICAIQSTRAEASNVRGGDGGGGGGGATLPDAGEPQKQHHILLEDLSEQDIAKLRGYLLHDRYKQDSTINNNNKKNQDRTLQGEDNSAVCGILQFPCTHGAVCKPDNRNGGADWCFCDRDSGYIDNVAPDIPAIALFHLQGYRSCIPADECSNQSGTTNVCASTAEGGGCEDRDPDNGKYMCFCKEGYLADPTSIGNHGPEACTQLNECLAFENICGDDKVCIDTPGSFGCYCDAGMVETKNGDCLAPPTVAENLISCDPTSGSDCSKPGQECDEELQKCICKTGWIQPSGAGGQCQLRVVNECEAQTDTACDRRGRGGANPRSKCIDRSPIDGDGNPRQGYTCECLPGFVDSPNAIRGTNCLEVIDPTPAPVSPSPTTFAPVAVIIEQPLPCTTFVCTAPFSFCAAKQNKCVCQNGYIQSLGSPFACEEECFADADCLGPYEECFNSRCTCIAANSYLGANGTCANPCDPSPCPNQPCTPIGGANYTCESRLDINVTIPECANPPSWNSGDCDSTAVRSDMVVFDDCTITSVTMAFTVIHPFLIDLVMTLTHGDTNKVGNICTNCGPSPQSSPLFNGDSASGIWTLTVSDVWFGYPDEGAGSLTSWYLDFGCAI